MTENTANNTEDVNVEGDEIEEEKKKPKKFQTLRGFQDLLPDLQDYYTMIKKSARHRGRQSGFKRITTPIMEETGVFSKRGFPVVYHQ
jgi:hypothetical protein